MQSSPRTEHDKLVGRIKHTRSYDPELSATRIAQRYGCSIGLVQRVLRGEETFPAKYNQLAKRYKLKPQVVQDAMEKNLRYCIACEAFADLSEFYRKTNSSLRHRAPFCLEKKDEQ